MDLYQQSVSRRSNIGLNESSSWLSIVRNGRSMRKISDWDSGIEGLCGIVFSSRGIGYLKVKGALQFLNFSTLGKITISICNNNIIAYVLHLKYLFNLQEDLTGEDFKEMPGSLLYKLLQTKSKYPLHAAVRLMREDVVFLYLVENNAEVSSFFLFDNKSNVM